MVGAQKPETGTRQYLENCCYFFLEAQCFVLHGVFKNIVLQNPGRIGPRTPAPCEGTGIGRGQAPHRKWHRVCVLHP